MPSQLLAQADGVFTDVHPLRFASVLDGLSSTLFVTEKAVASFEAMDAVQPQMSLRKAWYVSGDLADTLLTTFSPPNISERVPPAALTARLYSASSLHVGGVNVLFGDGAVKFMSDSIDSWLVNSFGEPQGASKSPGGWWVGVPRPGVWQALGTRAGKEPVGH